MAASSSELEDRDTARGLLFYKLRRGLHRTVAEYTRDTTPSRLCSRDKLNLFTPTLVWLVSAERVNFTHKTWRSAGIIISVCAFQYLHSLQLILINLICELFPFCILLVPIFKICRENNKIKIRPLLILKFKIIFIYLSATQCFHIFFCIYRIYIIYDIP